jgi:3-oxoacyl-[acyl-carrier-protein] synthase II
MSSSSNVVVTGLGAVSPCGLSLDDTWSAVVEGRSPIRPITRFPLLDAATRLAGSVPGFEDGHPEGGALADTFAQMAVDAAMADAGLEVADGPVADVVVVGNHGERRVPSTDGPSTVSRPTDLAEQLATGVGAGRWMAAFGACAAGGQSIVLGALAIRSGTAEVALCVGVDALLSDFDFFQFAALYAMSTRDCGPTEASCPFDARRDGFVLSEGAACLVLESEDHAKRRGAEPLARLEGMGVSQNAYHMIASPPDAVGPARAMKVALQSARLDPGRVGNLNAHGTSTRDNDWCESLAIRKAFGHAADSLAVSGTKAVTGHLMAAAGALEAAMSIKALRDGIIAPTFNLTEPDPRCDLDYVPGEARSAPLEHVMSNCFGFGGHNVSLVFGRA